MLTARSIIVISLLAAAPHVQAGYWISEITAPYEGYRIMRGNKTIRPEQLMLMQTGDVVFLDDKTARIVLLNESDERFVFTHADSPFVVPESKAPPGLLANVRNLLAHWWSTRGSQSTMTTAAVSRGALEPTASAVSGDVNLLLPGSRAIVVRWSGGIPPFDVQLVDSSGVPVVQVASVDDFEASLPRLDLDKGQRFEIRVSDGGSSSVIPISIVEPDKLPEPARTVHGLDVADEIRLGIAAMILSTHEPWRFEALQLARTYKLDELEDGLLTESLPQSPPDWSDVDAASQDSP